MQLFIDGFHMLRTAAVLMHPVAPEGTEKILDYLNLDDGDEEFWSWDRIFEPVTAFIDNPKEHHFKEIGSRTDFFEKHPRQYN